MERRITFKGYPEPLLTALNYLKREYQDSLELEKTLMIETNHATYEISVYRPPQNRNQPIDRLENVLHKHATKIFYPQYVPLRKNPVDLCQPWKKYVHTDEIVFKAFKDTMFHKVLLKKKGKTAVIEIKPYAPGGS